MSRLSTWIALALLLVVAAFARHHRIGTDAISLDEMWHLGLSTGRGSPQLDWPSDALVAAAPAFTELDGAPPWYSCWTGMKRVLHPPLFVLTLRLWREAFGPGDVAAQWYVALWSLLALVAVFDIVRTLARDVAGALWVVAILAVAPTQILLSQEIRAYTMLLGLAACTIAAAARIETLGLNRRRVVALGLCLLAMMLTHYFAIGVCAAIVVWAHARFRGRQLAALWAAFGSAGLAYLLGWVPLAVRQIPDISATADWWLQDQAPNAPWLALARFLAMPVRLLVDLEPDALFGTALGGALLALALPLLRRRRELLLPVLWFLGVCGFLLLLDWARTTKHLVYVRYSLPAAPAIAMIAIMIWRSPGAAGNAASPGSRSRLALHLAGAAVLGLLLWQYPRAYYAGEPDYRVLRKFAVEHVVADEALLFYSGPVMKDFFPHILMLAASREPTLFPRNLVKLSKPAEPELLRSIPGTTAWLFSGPLPDVSAVLPGCTLLERRVLVDSDGRFVAMCSRIQLPG